MGVRFVRVGLALLLSGSAGGQMASPAGGPAAGAGHGMPQAAGQGLPNAPSAQVSSGTGGCPCPAQAAAAGGQIAQGGAAPAPAPGTGGGACDSYGRFSRFVNAQCVERLTAGDKAVLSVANMVDPGNIAGLVLSSGFTVATDSHGGYGPGWKGFGRSVGYGFVEEGTGQFFGTFLIPALAHEDPRYHRLGHGSGGVRLGHALAHTFVATHDDGRRMVNISTVLTYPISAEISNLYVPGVAVNGPSTVERVLLGYATNPVDDVISEFLPDVARHLHVHVIFVQRVLDRISNQQ